MRYDFEDLSKLPIQDCHLYDCAASGHRAARDLKCSIDDCPWGVSRDQRIRCYRIAWRTAFRRARKLRSGQTSTHLHLLESAILPEGGGCTPSVEAAPLEPAHDLILRHEFSAFIVNELLNGIDGDGAQVRHAFQPSKQVEAILFTDQLAAIHIDNSHAAVWLPPLEIN